jgi:hypothetical protein
MNIWTITYLCAECGGVAGDVGLVAEGQLVDLGRPFGMEPSKHASVTLDYFGIKVVERAEAERFARLSLLFEQGPPDAKELSSLYWVPFFCPQCRLVYCQTHWSPIRAFYEEGGSYDRSEGTCPRGHISKVDD